MGRSPKARKVYRKLEYIYDHRCDYFKIDNLKEVLKYLQKLEKSSKKPKKLSDATKRLSLYFINGLFSRYGLDTKTGAKILAYVLEHQKSKHRDKSVKLPKGRQSSDQEQIQQAKEKLKYIVKNQNCSYFNRHNLKQNGKGLYK